MSTDRRHVRLVKDDVAKQSATTPGELPWTALVKRAQRGDIAAFEQLIGGHQDAAYAFAMALVGEQAEASDITQEALIKAYRRLSTYRFAASFRSWLLQIVRNAFRDRYRQRQQRKVKQQRLVAHSVNEAPASPEQQLMDKQLSRQLYDALGRLEPQFREVVVLFDLQGFAYREIAEICQAPMGTVKSRLRRGRDGLRRILVEDGVIGSRGASASGGGRR